MFPLKDSYQRGKNFRVFEAPENFACILKSNFYVANFTRIQLHTKTGIVRC